MKAIEYTAFGGPEVIVYTDVQKPVIGEDEVLVQAVATSVNPAEIKFREGGMQHLMPISLPYIPGLDVAGIVMEKGEKVVDIQIGDAVYGGKFGGTYAEFVVLKNEQFALAPTNISLQESASLVVGIVTAYTFLIDNGQVKPGDNILIQGAAGGTGAVMLQMAKSLGAYVIGIASGEGVAKGYELGADKMIDYKTADFTTLVHDMDLVIDFAGGNALNKAFAVVKKGGKLYSASMPPSAELAVQYEVEAKFISSTYSREKLDYGTRLVMEGKLKPQVVKIMPLKEAAAAQQLLSEGGLNGKIVLEIKA